MDFGRCDFVSSVDALRRTAGLAGLGRRDELGDTPVARVSCRPGPRSGRCGRRREARELAVVLKLLEHVATGAADDRITPSQWRERALVSRSVPRTVSARSLTISRVRQPPQAMHPPPTPSSTHWTVRRRSSASARRRRSTPRWLPVARPPAHRSRLDPRHNGRRRNHAVRQPTVTRAGRPRRPRPVITGCRRRAVRCGVGARTWARPTALSGTLSTEAQDCTEDLPLQPCLILSNVDRFSS
jgi:hypothetical protein